MHWTLPIFKTLFNRSPFKWINKIPVPHLTTQHYMHWTLPIFKTLFNRSPSKWINKIPVLHLTTQHYMHWILPIYKTLINRSPSKWINKIPVLHLTTQHYMHWTLPILKTSNKYLSPVSINAITIYSNPSHVHRMCFVYFAQRQQQVLLCIVFDHRTVWDNYLQSN